MKNSANKGGHERLYVRNVLLVLSSSKAFVLGLLRDSDMKETKANYRNPLKSIFLLQSAVREVTS